MKLSKLCMCLIAFALAVCFMTATETVRASANPVIEKAKISESTPCVNSAVLAETHIRQEPALIARRLSINTNYAPVLLVAEVQPRELPAIVRRT